MDAHREEPIGIRAVHTQNSGRGSYLAHINIYLCLARFGRGPQALGVLDAMRAHPALFKDAMCWTDTPFSAESFGSLFTGVYSSEGTQNRMLETRVTVYWKHFLGVVEGNIVFQIEIICEPYRNFVFGLQVGIQRCSSRLFCSL